MRYFIKKLLAGTSRLFKIFIMKKDTDLLNDDFKATIYSRELTHIRYTYKGEDHSVFKPWSFERCERVLRRLGATMWSLTVDISPSLKIRKKGIMKI